MRPSSITVRSVEAPTRVGETYRRLVFKDPTSNEEEDRTQPNQDLPLRGLLKLRLESARPIGGPVSVGVTYQSRRSASAGGTYQRSDKCRMWQLSFARESHTILSLDEIVGLKFYGQKISIPPHPIFDSKQWLCASLDLEHICLCRWSNPQTVSAYFHKANL
ncbi:hypothetical protein Acr_07g0012470 [Actinidia rufa]|uniref:Uncharacterized protein n=1 Tax=Actinidia rufa TaxID=165716 RepID=A0A7J0EX44_9ERIC|nr:hypothetical protein Acr_07g0012470 [Actinidia rufa]